MNRVSRTPSRPGRIQPVFRMFPLVALILAAGCSSVSVSRDFDPTFNFGQLRTYGFIPITPESGLNDIDANRIAAALDSELGAKGYQKSESPDFLVAVHFGAQEKMQIDSYGYGYGSGWYGRGGGGMTAYQYTQGTLIIDFVSAASKSLVWQGVGKGVLGENLTPEKKASRINEAVAQIVDQFPPR